MANRAVLRTTALALLVFASCATERAARAPSRGHEPHPVHEFQERIRHYVKHAHPAAAQRRVTADPNRIDRGVNDRAAAIRRLRPSAGPGDLFHPDITAYITAIVRSEVKGPLGTGARRALRDDAPRQFTPVVNGDYPGAETLSTMPPNLLARLPRLPEALDYRFAGRHLLLRDVEANLILDYIEDCLPPQ